MEKAYNYELKCHGCSQAVLLTSQELLGLKDEMTFKAAGAVVRRTGHGQDMRCIDRRSDGIGHQVWPSPHSGRS
jgi:hypothetical protein